MAAVVILLVAAVISSTINLLTENTQVRGMVVNITMEQRAMNYLKGDYAKEIGADRDDVQLSYIAFGDLADQAESEQNFYASMSVVNEVSAKMLDYMILDHHSMEFYGPQGVYGDLADLLPAEELAQLESEGRVITASEEGSTEVWVIAIDITDTAFIKDNVSTEGKVYFSIAGNAPHKDMCLDVWNRINQWETPQ